MENKYKTKKKKKKKEKRLNTHKIVFMIICYN